MAKEFDIYTGTVDYKGITFMFMFDKNELRLIPPKEKQNNIQYDWFSKEISPGVYTFVDLPVMEEAYLTGRCNEDGRKIIFITQQGASIRRYNSVLVIAFVGYIICRYDRDAIDRINFCGPEINCIHPIGQAFSFAYKEEWFKKGILNIQTNSFEDTTTKEQSFFVDDHCVKVHFGISRGISTGVGETPLKLNSSLTFDFDPTNDYDFIHKIWRIAKGFIQYLCYSQGVTFSRIELLAPYEGGKHEGFATLTISSDKAESDFECLKKGYYIRQKDIAGFEGKILNDIASGKLYLRHIPETYKKGKHKNAADFILIMAAFEWELKQLFPELEKGKRNGKKVTLSEKISNAIKEMIPIMEVFGEQLYGLNQEVFNGETIGMRLAKQRNNFSHGNLDQDFIGNSLLDLIFMEYFVYGMQLKKYGIPEINIQRCINDLFQKHIMLKETTED
ncbi:MAG: hypothetical protein LKI32_04560 [Lachnospiraceae bacterium]|nr:hypothetical protein [Lachnospiraceae bacterium]MCI1656812.1 hypothetical protein [Lachnospiraceae bacterium]MCI2195182.1 hypothetical protein [Lachnospiraceae bacterium]